MSLNIHKTIHTKLNYFIEIAKIPNIIFHGPNGSGKRTIVHSFLNKIYNNDKERLDSYVLYVDCAHDGKGIKFIRNELKFFAKKHIDFNKGKNFKTIVLLNADKLTIDAQSALRRCIELFTHTTRFFIIIQNINLLLKPILSRFCDIYIPSPFLDRTHVNLYKYKINNAYFMKEYNKKHNNNLKTLINKHKNGFNSETLMFFSKMLYKKGFCGLDLIEYLKGCTMNELKKNGLLVLISKIKREIRNEELIMYIILNYIFIRSESELENILFM